MDARYCHVGGGGAEAQGREDDAPGPVIPTTVDPDVAAAVKRFGVRPVAREIGAHWKLVQLWLKGEGRPSAEHRMRLQRMLIGEVSDAAREERLARYAARAAAGLGIFDEEPGPVPPEEEIFGLDLDDPEVQAYEYES